MFSVFYRTPRDEALRVLVLVEGHPHRLSELRSWYPGRHDVLDALWWRLHPLEVSPRGIPDPASQRDAIQRRAFSRSGEDSPIVDEHDPSTGEQIHLTADELRLLALDRVLAEDAAALDAAIARFSAAYPSGRPQEHPPPGTAAGTPAPAADGDEVDAPLPRPAPPVPGRLHRFTAALAAATALLLVATGALWWRLDEVTRQLDTVVASDSPSTAALEAWQEANDTSATALRVFDRPQTLDDAFPLTLPAGYRVAGVRQLQPYSTGDQYRVFGVLAEDDLVCLVAVMADLSTASSCTPAAEFADTGLTVTTHATRSRGRGTFVSHHLIWQPDGQIQYATGDR